MGTPRNTFRTVLRCQVRAASLVVLLALRWEFLTSAAGQTGPGKQELTPEEQKQLLERVKASAAKWMELHRQERYGQAVQAAEEVVGLCQRLYANEMYPQGHPNLATSLSNLGV